jgi:iron(III) transport system substrate-binding protein
MTLGRVLLVLSLAVLLGVPLLARPKQAAETTDLRRLVIVSPHNEQIRRELGDGFVRWHLETHGEPVQVVWSTPGGTSEIRTMLVASVEAALREGRPIGGNADLLFGGGSYEFGLLTRPIEVLVDGEPRSARALAAIPPEAFPPGFLEEVYGENRIGDEVLYDPQGYWYGVALSGFGIVYNRELLGALGVPIPQGWADLCDPRLFGWVVSANPGQSGSVATAMETILQRRGWEEGWAILRRMAGNTRAFVSSGAKAPIDVSLGEAAAGLCIDFFGRYQSQSLREAALRLGDPRLDRLGYIDPPGQTVIDPDPIALLEGAIDRELAIRFVEFALRAEGQALWQFAAGSPAEGGAPAGPQRFELRRMPVRRDLYRDHFDRMVDRVNPYEVASAAPEYDPSMRAFIAPLLSAMAIDRKSLLRRAWRAIIEHPAYPDPAIAPGLVRASEVSDPQLRAMLEAFDAMPMIEGPERPEGPEGARFDLSDRAMRSAVRAGWLRRGWSDAGLWHPEAMPATEFRRRTGAFFEAQYRRVLEIAARGAAS